MAVSSIEPETWWDWKTRVPFPLGFGSFSGVDSFAYLEDPVLLLPKKNPLLFFWGEITKKIQHVLMFRQGGYTYTRFAKDAEELPKAPKGEAYLPSIHFSGVNLLLNLQGINQKQKNRTTKVIWGSRSTQYFYQVFEPRNWYLKR